MIRYTIPGMTEFPDLCLLFCSLWRKQPDMFFPDVAIESVYGGFPGSQLGGGRNNVGPQMETAQVAEMLGRYNELGIGCNATFTSQHAGCDELAEGSYERMLLETLAAGEGNGAILWSDELADCVRRDFPGLVLVASTTKELADVAQTEALLGRYDRAVLEYNIVHDAGKLACITRPEGLEIMVNEYCTLHCPWRCEHYADVSRCQYEGRVSAFACRHEPAPQAHGFLQGLVDGEVFLKNARVRAIAEEHGIEHFKIVGRGLERYDVVDALLYYLVQPDCWYEVRDFLIRHRYLG